MTNKEFFDFCYNQYRLEIEHGESVYRRGAFLLTSQAVLGGMAYSLASCKYVHELFTRIDIFIYYACTAGALVLAAISVIYMLKAVMLRPYPDIETMPEWVKWREKMLCHIASQPEDQKDPDCLFPQLIGRMAEAQKGWSLRTEARNLNIRSAILYAALALACIAGQGLFLFILRVRETINV